MLAFFSAAMKRAICDAFGPAGGVDAGDAVGAGEIEIVGP